MKSKSYDTSLSVSLKKIFTNAVNPVSIKDIYNILKKDNLTFNKTTLYRQLNKFVENKFLRIIRTTNCNSWELNSFSLHVHFECGDCKQIICTLLDPALIISKVSQDFKIQDVNIKGICKNC